MEFTKIEELEKMKEDLKEAKEEAMQSWLDSRPLIDELERMQAELERAKKGVAKANVIISALQSQLETTNMYKNQALHKAQEEMEQLKVKRDKKRRTKSRLKLVLRLKRQSLRTSKLTCEAIQLETDALATSAARALRHINNYYQAENNNNPMVQLTQPEYDYLKKEAAEQTSVAEWRILACAEEKLAAEKSRDLAFRRLHNLYPKNKEGTKYTQTRKTSQQQYGNNSRFLVKRKKSIFFRIKTFIVRNIAKYFK